MVSKGRLAENFSLFGGPHKGEYAYRAIRDCQLSHAAAPARARDAGAIARGGLCSPSHGRWRRSLRHLG